jgi:hypothetical protein
VKDEMERPDTNRDLSADGAATEVCRRYEARLEDALEGAADAELAQHVNQCAGCRAALERAQVAAAMLRVAEQPVREADGRFVARVMALIRNEQEARATAGAFWVPVQTLASRLALAAGMLLLALSLYVYKTTPRQVAQQPARAEAAATADFPQPPAQPSDKDEVLASLSGSHYGY